MNPSSSDFVSLFYGTDSLEYDQATSLAPYHQ
jgi:hypothetical protein